MNIQHRAGHVKNDSDLLCYMIYVVKKNKLIFIPFD